MYKIRAILDSEEDVIRTLHINEKSSLEDLHFSIAKAFGFDGHEMASFYLSDDKWSQNDEIPLFNMSEIGEGVSMSNYVISDVLKAKNNKLIYVYDFFNMWTFYIEMIDFKDILVEEVKVILSVGEVPEENSNNKFDIQDLSSKSEEDFGDQFDDFENFTNIDDIDLDKF